MSEPAASRPADRRRGLLAFIVLVASALGFLLLELGLRIHHLAGRPERIEDLARMSPPPEPGSRVGLGDILRPSPDERIVYEMRPDLDVRMLGSRLRSNPQGWRDAPFEHARPAGTVRIVALGDSVLFGWGVEADERYADRLEAMLDARHPERRWEILVFALPGYNLPMQIAVLERYGLDYAPDAILYAYVANDACLPNFVVGGPDVFAPTSFVVEYLRGLPEAARPLLERDEMLGGDPKASEFSDRYCVPESVPARYRGLVGQARLGTALSELGRIGADRGVPVVLLSHPLMEVFPEPSLPEGMLRVDALRGFDDRPGASFSQRRNPEQLRLSERDPHPTAAGHALIARNVFEQLEAQGVWRALVAASE